MPRLTNDFSDRAYFFVDVIRDLDLGVTSTSDVVFFTISDVDGLAFVADVVSDNDCVVTGVTDGEFVLPATGICERQADDNAFLVDDLSSLSVDFPLLQGLFCDEVIFFNTSSLNETSSKRNEGLVTGKDEEIAEKVDILIEKFQTLRNQ